MEIKDVLYDDIDDALDRQEESEDIEVIDISEEDSVVVYSPIWHVTDKNVYFAEGVWCIYNERMHTLEPDWSVTLVFDEVVELDKFVYFDSSSPSVAIHNYLYMKNQKV